MGCPKFSLVVGMRNFRLVMGNPGISLIHCNTDSCCEHIIGGVNITSCGCVCLLAPLCAVCLCSYACDVKSES